MISIAVPGCGRIGTMHAANIAADPRATLSAVFDINRPAARILKSIAEGRVVRTSEVGQDV